MNDEREEMEAHGKKKEGFMSWLDDPEKARTLFFASLFFNHGPGGPGGPTGFGGFGF